MQTEHDRYFKEEHEIFRKSILSFYMVEIMSGIRSFPKTKFGSITLFQQKNIILLSDMMLQIKNNCKKFIKKYILFVMKN